MKLTESFLLLIGICCACLAAAQSARSQDEAEPVLATIGKVSGKALVQRIGKASWVPAREGLELYDGDSVRVSERASAIINFPERGYLKLLPQTEVTITAAQSPQGAPVAVATMGEGRAWARLDVKEDGGQFIVMTENAVVNGRKATAFVESVTGKENSCLDVFQGMVSIRPRMYQDKVTNVRPGQRELIGMEQTVSQPESIAAGYDEALDDYSCLPAEEKAAAAIAKQQQQAAAPSSNATSAAGTPGTETAEIQSDEVVIRTSTTNAVVFNPQATLEAANQTGGGQAADQTEEQQASQEISDDEVVAFSPDKAPATPAGGQASANTGESGAQAGAPEEDEYETVEIVRSLTLNVVSAPASASPPVTAPVEEAATATAACNDRPVISDMIVSGAPAAAGDSLSIKSASKCGPVLKPVIVWSAAPPKCPGASVASMSVVNGGITTRLPGGAAGEAAQGKFSFDINDSTARNLIVKALGSNGLEAQYTFSITVPEPENIPPPVITDLMVNGTLVKDKQVLNIDYDECETAEFYIEGKAKSDCGEIVNVTVNAHEAPLTVNGTDEWNTTLFIDQTQTVPVNIAARDVTGAKSKQLNFSIDFTKAVTPPNVSIDLVAGNPVSAGGMDDPIDVYRNDLVGGKLVVSGGAGSDRCTMKKVEASVNAGSTWAKADGQNAWSYGFVPRDGDYQIVARSFDLSGTQSEEMFQPVEITYYSKTREEILQEAFDQIIRAYQDRDSDTINTNTESSFSTRYDSIEDRGRMDNSLNAKFVDLSLIYVRYRVQTVQVSGKSGRVTFQWDANPNSSGYSKTGTFVFKKERAGWMLLNVEDDRTFLRYTDIADSIALTAANPKITANNIDTTTITGRVLDSAGVAVKNGTNVRFSATTGTINSNATTTDGLVTVTYTASDAIGPVTITATSGGVSSTVNIELLREFAPPPPGP